MPWNLSFFIIFEGILTGNAHSAENFKHTVDRLSFIFVIAAPCQQDIVVIFEQILHETHIAKHMSEVIRKVDVSQVGSRNVINGVFIDLELVKTESEGVHENIFEVL